MATLTDIALNDPTAVETLARTPLSLVGTAAEKTGTAAATPEDTLGALVMARLDPYYAYRQTGKQRRIKAVEDIYAAQESRLREQRVGMTKGERLLETLAAFGQPVSGGMGEALANAARVTTARNQSEREADRARQDKLAELSLAQKIKLEEQSADYDEKELALLGKLGTSGAPDLVSAGVQIVDGRPIAIVLDRTTGATFASVPGQPSPVPLPKNATVAQLTAAIRGGASTAPATPSATPSARGSTPELPAGVSPYTGDGDEWKLYINKVVEGSKVGGSKGMYYQPTAAGLGDPLKRADPLQGDAALVASGGAYNRGYMTNEGFKPADEKDRRPLPEEYQANLTRLSTGIQSEQAKLNQLRSLSAQLTPYTTGLLGSAMKFVPGSAALTVREDIKTAVSAIVLSKLNELKQQSATGASGLGSVTEKELDLLGVALGSLNQAKNDKDLKRAVDTIAKHYAAALSAMQRDGQMVAREYKRVKNLLSPEPEAEAKVKTWNPKLNNGRGGFE